MDVTDAHVSSTIPEVIFRPPSDSAAEMPIRDYRRAVAECITIAAHKGMCEADYLSCPGRASGRWVPNDSAHMAVQALAARARLEQHHEDFSCRKAEYDSQHPVVPLSDIGNGIDAPALRPEDDPRMRLPVLVLVVTEITKAIVRAAPPASRRYLWQAMTQRLEEAQESSADKMPWDDASTVLHISKLAALRVITRSLDDLISEKAIRTRLLTIAAEEATALESAPATTGTKRPGRKHLKPRQCARDGCPETFEPSRPGALYHAEACRSAAYKARKRAKATGTSG